MFPMILPSSLDFNTGAPEIMDVIEGRCLVQLAGSDVVTEYGAGQSFSVPAQSRFHIVTLETLSYVCHYG